MKRLIICCSLFLSCFSVFSQMNRKYEKMIKKYDIAKLLTIYNGSPEDFWHQIEYNHSGLLAYKQALATKRKSALEAQSDVAFAMNLAYSKYADLYIFKDESATNYTKQVTEVVLGTEADRIRFRIAYGRFPNAFCTPRGDIYVYSSLLDCIDYDNKMLYGILAHEVAHYYLRHSVRQQWADKKKERKSKIWAGIAIGMSAVADGMAAYNAGYYGYNYESHLYETCQSILAASSYDNAMYHFKFSREQEIEADIVAYRFLEFIGVDPNLYVKALYLLGTDNDDFYSSWDDHPTISFRTNFLLYLGKNYPLKPITQ